MRTDKSKMRRLVFEDEKYDRRTHCCANREKNKCIEDWSFFPSEKLCPIRMIIENDDADGFDTFLRKTKLVYRKNDKFLKYAGFEMCPYGILGKICHHRAYKCATLLLSRRRKVGRLMKLDIFNCYGSYPIHDAAISLCPSMVKLFLDHGACPNARLDVAQICPMEYAVERLSCDTNLINWSPKKSVFKLIITLCLPQMREALETIDLLAGVLGASTVMNDTIFSAVKREQVVPVAVLLLLARDSVMQSFYLSNKVSSGHDLQFPEAVLNELGALINQESALVGSIEHAKILQLCRRKKELMIYFLQMIEISNRAGPALKSYLEDRTSDVTNEQVSYDVAKLLEGTGFVLSTNDYDMSDITSSSKPDLIPLEATLEQQEYDEEDDREGIFFKPCREQLCRCNMRTPACTTSNVFQRIVGTSFSYNHHRGFSSRAGPSIHQPLWTIPRRDICFLPCSPNVCMPNGYKDRLDVRNCNALAETIFRVLDGRKVEKLNLEDTHRFQNSLENCLENKFKEALKEKGPNKQAEEKKRSTPRLSLPCCLTLQPGLSYSLSEVSEHLNVKIISSTIFSAVKKGKA